MPTTMNDILHPGVREQNPDFPNAPEDWTKASAEAIAKDEGVAMTDDVWEVIRVLQAVHSETPNMPMRLAHDALEARFADKGGRRFLFTLLPGGPMVQGCRLAGLLPPIGSTDESFGTVS